MTTALGADRPVTSPEGSPAVLVYSEKLTRYDFGDHHPMAPGRVAHTVALARALGVLDRMRVVGPSEVDEALLRTVHTDAYIRAVQRQVPDPRYGIGTPDNPIVEGMHEIAATVAMATVDAARLVWSGAAPRAANIAGGLHHAMPAATSGFCVYNDLALAIQWLLDSGCERVGYVDVDVHHGDGVQSIFYDDPRVLTISLHENPLRLFPGTGFPTESGGPRAPASAVNVALPSGTRDDGWLRAFHAVVPEALREFSPQILVTQHGCDTHRSDPLADLQLTVDGQRAAYLALAGLADELCGGRWVATGGGGYSILQAVPRSWTHLLAVLSGSPLDPRTPIPAQWRDLVGSDAPADMSDLSDPSDPADQVPDPVSYVSWDHGWDPASPLDQAIRATRSAVFPELGLDPEG